MTEAPRHVLVATLTTMVGVGLWSGACSSAPSSALPRPVAPPPSVSASAATSLPEPPSSVSVTPPKAPPIEGRTVVLHVGDSFVHSGLAQRLKEHLEPLGARYVVNAQHSTNSLDWSNRVGDLVLAHRPDLVLVTLGGNEIASRHLKVQARAIEKIVRSIGDRPCVWITPPLWREEYGLIDTIQTHAAPCRFFETDRVIGKPMPRRGDGIHPTAEGGAMWADALFAWLEREREGQPKPWSLREAPEDERNARGPRTALRNEP